MDADGSNLRVLTSTGNCYGPTYSRDGRSILYQERTDDKSAGRIFVVSASGGSPQEYAWPSGLDGILRGPFVWRPEKPQRE
jgi:Tol biopolymer transport system component